jgi:hypothetical protein
MIRMGKLKRLSKIVNDLGLENRGIGAWVHEEFYRPSGALDYVEKRGTEK